MREFETGATRDNDDDKLDYEGFFSPLALRRYGEYMHKHRVQADGKVRDSDNWQKGIPIAAYMKSLWRHLVDLWTLHRKYLICWPPKEASDGRKEALCAIIFNASGYLHELEKGESSESQWDDTPDGTAIPMRRGDAPNAVGIKQRKRPYSGKQRKKSHGDSPYDVGEVRGLESAKKSSGPTMADLMGDPY